MDIVRNLVSTILQVANYQTGEAANGSTAMPFDNSIPQSNEGTEFMTLNFTPKSATSKLKIDITFNCTVSNADFMVALFKDSDADALACAFGAYVERSGNYSGPAITFSHYMTAGTTSQITFKVRAGAYSGATVYFNSDGSGRIGGGKLASGITITEIA